MNILINEMITEQRNADTMNLDMMTPLELITEMNREDKSIPAAITPHLPQIAKIVEWGIESLTQGGRIFYMGAGTSGRLGVLDASECPPTFGVSPDTVIGLIAGGERAFTKAVEGAEDDRQLGEDELKVHHLTCKDLVIGLAASGRTPYVLGGLAYANQIGCHTAAVSCNHHSAIGHEAQIGIDVITGPEVLTGSTRLKAGTAQKMILNMISTAAMVGCGKAYQNLMVDVVQTNEKLKKRALHIVEEVTGVDETTAADTLEKVDGNCKTAITMILGECNALEARDALANAGGHVRAALSCLGRFKDGDH